MPQPSTSTTCENFTGNVSGSASVDCNDPKANAVKVLQALVEFASPGGTRAEYAMYDTVKALNDTLKILGAALYPEVSLGEHRPLTWDDNYDNFSTDGLSASTLIDSVRASADSSAAGRLEFGQFHDTAADYVLAVNRDSLVSGGAQTIDLRFDPAQMTSDKTGYRVYVVSETVTGFRDTLVADAAGHVWVPGQRLAPGDGRLYRIRGLAGLWAGPVQGTVSWKDTVRISGDVTVQPGATLTAASGTTVLFAAHRDDTGGGLDTTKSELIVAGTLNASSVRFRSTNAAPDKAEWYGLRVLSGGRADLTNARLEDGVRCLRNAGTLTLSATTFSSCGMMTGSGSVSHAENGPLWLGTYRAASLQGVSFSWTLSDVDKSAFQVLPPAQVQTQTPGLAPSGPQVELGFRSAPDFERPTDQGKDNTYRVTVRATGLQASSSEGAVGQVAPMVQLGKDVTVTVTNVEEAGTVSLSPALPRAGHPVTATLTDPDSSISGTGWQWQRLSSRSAAGTPIASATAASYTPQAADVGRWLVARASYTDGHGSGKSAGDTTAAAVADVPGAPKSLTAQAGNKQVALSWAAADSHGAWISGYSLRDSLAKGSWSTWAAVPGGGSARDTTLTGLTNGTRYWFAVRATNRVGAGPPDTLSARPQKLAVAGPDSVRFAENGTDTVAVYRVSPGGGSWTWSLGGADSSAFSAGDTLRFARAPDFEAPTDTDSNNVYTLQVRATPSGKGLASLSKAVAVTVTNVNEAGAIALSPPTPRVGQPITATLSDPDTVASVQRWRWLPYIEGIGGIGGAEEAGVEAASSGLSSTYTPGPFFQRLPLEVTVFYTDRLGSGRQVQVRTAPVGPPLPPNRAPTISGVGDTTFAENGTGPVALYTGADPDGNALTWTLAGADSSAFRWQGSGSSRQLRFRAAPDYETRSTYQVTAAVSDGRASATRAVTVRVTNVDEAPVLTGPADTTWAENGPGPVATYRAADPEGDAVTWSLSGADRDTLTLSGGRLSFKTAPDYEDPADRDGNNVYAVRVRAFDGPLADSLAVTVRVRNVEEAGAVSLSSSRPQQDTLLTATLSDPDSVWASTVGWQWHRLSSRSAAGTSIGSATAASYTPQAADVGRWLVAQASYTDGHGAGKSAVDTTAAAVAGPPGAPKSLTATAGNKQVALRWAAADSHGARISAYSLRDRLAKDSWSTWAVVPGGGSARDTTLTGLTNDTLYTFEVRATNRLGTGGTARVSATPQAKAPPPAPDTLTATAGNRQVTLKWTYTGSVTVSHWQYRQESDLQDFSAGQKSSTKIWGPWRPISGAATRSHTVTQLTNGSEYGFEVRGVNDDVPGASSNKATATPKAPPATGPEPPVLSATAGNGQVTLNWTYTGSVTVTGWKYRRQSEFEDLSGGQQSSTKIWGPWTKVPSGSGSTRSYTVTRLTNGSEYGFEVRGVNGGVDGGISNKVTATPKAPPPAKRVPPAATLSASAGNGQVALSWSYSGTVPVTGWQQHHKAGSKTWESWANVPSSTGTTRSYTVTGLTNDTLYTFEVRGVNGNGNGTASNQATATPKEPVPPAPTLSATAGNKQIALSWTYSGSVTVTHWQYRRQSDIQDFSEGQPANTKIWGPWANVPSSTGTTRSYTVTGLNNGSEYGFELRGVNGSGRGSVSNKVTATPRVPVPPAPTLSATAGNRQVALSWTYSGSVTVTGWKYRRQSEFEDLSGQRKSSTKIWGPWTAISGAATRSHTVTGLTNGSEYGFELRGVNGSVNGSVSNKVTATPKAPPKAPGAPRSLSATPGNQRVSLSWSAAAANGSAILRYEYRRDSGSWSTVSGGASARSRTVTGLTNGTSYTFKVRAVNGKGAGSVASVTATPKAPPKAPGAPGSLSATPGNKQVSLSWSAAAANGSAILRYEYRRDSGSWSTVSGGASARSRTVTGLTNGTSYTFKVRAVNGVGSGSSASVSATPKAPATVPGAPGSLSATPGIGQVTLNWSAAAANGSAILRYESYNSWSGWATAPGGASARSHTITDLFGGISYTFKVRAVNGVGKGSSASVTATPKEDFALGLNQPNPFNPETTLGYALPRAQPVRLTIYDMLGRPVRVLVDGEQPPGQHRVVWDGRDRQGRAVASGVYFYRLQTPLFSQTRKMILLR